MREKEFWVEVSFAGKVKMLIGAENEQEAKEKVFSDNATLDINIDEESSSIEEIEWDLYDGHSLYLDDFFIEELS